MSGSPAAPLSVRHPLRAWAEVLRAPLLLSPSADVLAGFCLAYGASAAGARPAGLGLSGLGALLRAALAGTCLLAAGMAQNALVDLEDDRRRKPERPLPRGALAAPTVRAAQYLLWAAALLLGATLAPSVLILVAVMILVTGAYHVLLKRLRLAGCLALGSLRGLDLMLGALAMTCWAQSSADPPLVPQGPVPVWAALYALSMVGASLHASTDDEPGRSPWSAFGLTTSVAALLLLGIQTARNAPNPGAAAWLTVTALASLVLALGRLVHGWRRLPAPALTGVALSSLYLVDAAACFSSGAVPLAPTAGVIVLLLFAASRLMLRAFAPT